jgi:hypothetical protein
MEGYLKVFGAGAACILAAQYMSETEFFRNQTNVTMQKALYYGAGGAALIVLQKVLGSASPLKAPG